MGVPSFYKWLVNKYPNVVVEAKEEKITNESGRVDSSQINNPNKIEFDNLYLDMNGIIHPCFHPEEHLRPPTTFEEVFESIFEYTDRLFQIVRPRNLLYLAIDGVAPRAKMNQQRSRRYRTAKDAEIAEAEEERLMREFEREGKQVLPRVESEVADSNIITPGTEFMDKLSKALQFYIRQRLENNSGWKNIKVILSDANVPGEGEHKIMKFIRSQRNQPGYNSNTRHCLYGLDADLIMLALSTHEPHFSLLREDVMTQVQQPINCSALESSLSKTEFNSIKSRGWFGIVLEKNEGDHLIKKPYNFLNIWTLREYLELDFQISNPPFEIDIERIIDDFIFMCFFIGNDFLPHVPSLKMNERAIDLLISVYKDGFKNRGGYLVDMEKVDDKKAAYVNLKSIEKFILAVGTYEEQILKKRSDIQERRLRNSLRNLANEQSKDEPSFTQDLESLQLKPKNVISRAPESSRTSETSKSGDEILENTKELKQKVKDYVLEKADLLQQFGVVKDKVKYGMLGWKERYYKEKFTEQSLNGVKSIPKDKIVEKYIEGLCWVLQYYFSEVPSWSWYYPYHHGPFASDMRGLARMNIKFKVGAPFKPFDQLMGVLPPRSVNALPKPYHKLMTSEESTIIGFYPTDFQIDEDGIRFLWQGIVKLPFIDEEQLLTETKKVENELKDDEAKRNSKGMDVMFTNKSHIGSKISVCQNFVGKVAIDVEASGGVNGFILPYREDFSNSTFDLKETKNVSKGRIICVQYELPPAHPHIPRLSEKVLLPEKTITKEDIVEEPLWHEYQGSGPPRIRSQFPQRYDEASNIRDLTSPNGAGGSGFSAGRGKFSPTSSSSSNLPPSTRMRSLKSETNFNQRNPTHIGQRWARTASDEANWRSKQSSGKSNSGQGSFTERGSEVGNNSFWPSRSVRVNSDNGIQAPRNASTTDRSTTTSDNTPFSAGRGRGNGGGRLNQNSAAERNERW